jgi:alpha-1,3-mannosyltransferase
MTTALANRAHHFHTTLVGLDRPGSPMTPRRRSPVVDFYLKHWSPILLSIELLLDLYFLQHGPLHPIDYPTYLVQARQVRLGERDYSKITGPTGPLVYPGGHVLIFTIFERLFGIKGDLDWTGYLPAQWIFVALQLGHTWVYRF